MRKHLKPAHIITVLFVAIVSVGSFLPFWQMLVMGTYSTSSIYSSSHMWFGDYLKTNIETISNINFGLFYRNSIVVALSASALCLIVSSMAGYAFAKYQFKLRKPMFNFILLTLMVPGQLGLIAFIIQMRGIGWMNTLLPLIVPSAASAFGVFWMTQYISSSVPVELLESGRIDGCGEFGIFLRIAVPIIIPAFTTLGLLNFLWSWNSFLTPMLIIEEEALFTIPLGIKKLSRQFELDVGATMLATSIATIPVLLLFSAFNKSLINGLTSGSVKG